ncbi:DUF2357 domain-containing protein [Leuconostoc suionicum]|nr:DUF2357 domain-containing protein [Leuconostoc suionicum]
MFMDSLSKLFLKVNKHQQLEMTLFNSDDLENLSFESIVKVREFSDLFILLDSSDNDYFEIPEMDDYYISDRQNPEKNGHYKYQANKPFCLFSLNDSNHEQVVPLVPALYTIKISLNGIQYYSYFRIVPKDLTIADWEIMKDEIEDTISGLSFDFYRRKNSQSLSNELNKNEVNTSMTKIQLFVQNEQKIRFVVEKLRQEAKYKISTQHHWENNGGKNYVDSVTIRKMGERPDKKNMVFAVKRYIDYDVPENRWAKKILDFFIVFSKQSILHLEGIEYGLVQERKKNEYFDSRRNNSDVYFQKNRLQTNLSTVAQDINRLSKLVAYFRTVLKDDFLQVNGDKVNSVIPKALVLNSKYNFLYRLFNSLKKSQHKITLDHAYEYFWKRTDNLYETWTYIESIKALQSIGYQPQDGWIFSKDPYNDLLPKLEPDETVIFRNKAENTIRLVFNSQMKKTGKSTVENPLLTDSNRSRPDIRLDMFDSKNDYAGSILLDAKYKRLAQVLRSYRGEKGIMEQFREYKKDPYVSKGFWHVKDSFQSQLMPVQSVIVLYPFDDESPIRQQTIDQYIFMLELNPHFGLENFSKELEHQINERYEIFRDAT